MRGFSTRPSTEVTLTAPSGETLTLRVYARSIFHDLRIEAEWPIPAGDDPVYWHLRSILNVGACLCDEEIPERGEDETYREYALRLQDIFDAAGLTNNHLHQLAEVGWQLTHGPGKGTEAGNSSAPAGAASPA
jgi:hypothetical protein